MIASRYVSILQSSLVPSIGTSIRVLRFYLIILSLFFPTVGFAQDFTTEPNPQEIDNGSCRESNATFGGVLRVGGYLEPNRGCSAVLLSPTIAITAAHCLPNARRGTVTWRMHMQRKNSTITPCITYKSSNNTCSERIIDYVKHPDWVNLTLGEPVDSEDDVAVLHIRNNSFRLKNGSITKENFARLYNDVWHRSKKQILTGFGPCNTNGDWPDLYREVAVDIDEGDFFDKHYRDSATINSRLCKGDSGGPAFIRNSPPNLPIVVGINSSGIVEGKCNAAHKYQKFTKISPKAEWISREIGKFTGKPCRAPFADTTFSYLLCFD